MSAEDNKLSLVPKDSRKCEVLSLMLTDSDVEFMKKHDIRTAKMYEDHPFFNIMKNGGKWVEEVRDEQNE